MPLNTVGIYTLHIIIYMLNKTLFYCDVTHILYGLRCFRSRPAAGSSEETAVSSTAAPTSWSTSPSEVELGDPEDIPGLEDEELPHMLLPDSLSQLEEFGRHKRPRKGHRGHGRPRLFSDLWVRIGDG